MRIIAQYNDALAGQYDAATAKRNAWRAPTVCGQLLRRYLRPGMSVLDLGIGTGKYLTKIVGKRRSIVGVDISPNMLAEARKNTPQATLIDADLDRPLPLPRRHRFDIVLAVGALEFVKSLRNIFTEVAAHQSSGGLFCFTYEELIPHDPLQRFRGSPRGQSLWSPVPQLLSFPVYRRRWSNVRKLLKLSGFEILDQKSFIAYRLKSRLSGKRHPVRYRAVVAMKI